MKQPSVQSSNTRLQEPPARMAKDDERNKIPLQEWLQRAISFLQRLEMVFQMLSDSRWTTVITTLSEFLVWMQRPSATAPPPPSSIPTPPPPTPTQPSSIPSLPSAPLLPISPPLSPHPAHTPEGSDKETSSIPARTPPPTSIPESAEASHLSDSSYQEMVNSSAPSLPISPPPPPPPHPAHTPEGSDKEPSSIPARTPPPTSISLLFEESAEASHLSDSSYQEMVNASAPSLPISPPPPPHPAHTSEGSDKEPSSIPARTPPPTSIPKSAEASHFSDSDANSSQEMVNCADQDTSDDVTVKKKRRFI